MISIDPQTKTERENYKLLTGTVIPRPIAFVTSISADGVLNAAPFSYFNIVTADPPLLSVSIQRKNGEQKDTTRNILANQEFVIHIVDESNVHEVNKTAANLPYNESEIALTNLSTIPSEKIKVPAIAQAKVRYECRLEKHLSLGDGDQVSTDLIIARVEQYHIDHHLYEDNGRIRQEELGAVSRLAGHHYAKVGEMFELIRPK